MASKELDIFRRAKGALTTTLSVEQTKEEIRKQRAETQQEIEETANTHVKLIFALDATGSREQSWEESSLIQSFMFGAVNASGLKLHTQLVNYSGLTTLGDVAVGNWHNGAFSLNEEMKKIRCVTGGTQIAKVLQHALRENSKNKIHGVILVGDSCEESAGDLRPLAAQLPQSGIQLYVLDDERSTSRHDDTRRIFMAIAEAAEGVYLPFDHKNIPVLIDYLKVAAVTASGNEKAVDRMSETVATPEGREFLKKRKQQLLLTHDRK